MTDDRIIIRLFRYTMYALGALELWLGLRAIAAGDLALALLAAGFGAAALFLARYVMRDDA